MNRIDALKNAEFMTLTSEKQSLFGYQILIPEWTDELHHHARDAVFEEKALTVNRSFRNNRVLLINVEGVGVKRVLVESVNYMRPENKTFECFPREEAIEHFMAASIRAQKEVTKYSSNYAAVIPCRTIAHIKEAIQLDAQGKLFQFLEKPSSVELCSLQELYTAIGDNFCRNYYLDHAWKYYEDGSAVELLKKLRDDHPPFKQFKLCGTSWIVTQDILDNLMGPHQLPDKWKVVEKDGLDYVFLVDHSQGKHVYHIVPIHVPSFHLSLEFIKEQFPRSNWNGMGIGCIAHSEYWHSVFDRRFKGIAGCGTIEQFTSAMNTSLSG